MLLSTKRIVAQKSPLEVLAATFFLKIGMRCRQRRLMLAPTELRSVFFAQVHLTAGMSNVSPGSNRTTQSPDAGPVLLTVKSTNKKQGLTVLHVPVVLGVLSTHAFCPNHLRYFSLVVQLDDFVEACPNCQAETGASDADAACAAGWAGHLTSSDCMKICSPTASNINFAFYEQMIWSWFCTRSITDGCGMTSDKHTAQKNTPTSPWSCIHPLVCKINQSILYNDSLTYVAADNKSSL